MWDHSEGSNFSRWRPQGKLVTTLFEHKNAVNALAVTEDSRFFITGSRIDSIAKIWATKDIESDVTSHSHLQVKSQRQINSITAIENSNYFAIAGSQGGVDIYQLSRLEGEG
jgi:phosphoinositide-3-kinase regulatory subunit 4